ncbi:MAG: hypothetical protein GF405_06410 [Candidatus Eisenbacteria bacterium]|nr:hypothetical protein [Candidatus Eisenbacteria bacterium]
MNAIPNAIDAVIVVAGAVTLLATSGRVLTAVYRRVGEENVLVDLDEEARATGVVVGKCENLLILTLVLLGAYTALSIIFAGKAFVRREDLKTNSLYYLAGTMVNVTYSLLVALAVRFLVNTL